MGYRPPDESAEPTEPDFEIEEPEEPADTKDHAEESIPTDAGDGDAGNFPLFNPPGLSDLGLPPDYDDRYIPTEGDLRRAIVRRLDDEISFVMLHKDEPHEIAARLEKIAEVARIAAVMKGDHQVRGIRLGLALELKYWLMRDQVAQWPGLIFPLLKATLEIGDTRLQAEVYYTWSIYLHYVHEQKLDFDLEKDPASQSLLAALSYAEASGRADLHLLARVERFNVKLARMTVDDAWTEADDLIAQARAMNYTYIVPRVYFSMAARLLYEKGQFKTLYACAQQAMVYAAALNLNNLAGRAISMMLNGLHPEDGHSNTYRRQLVNFLARLEQYSNNPKFQAMVYHQLARQCYYDGEYNQARVYILKAAALYRSFHYRAERDRIRHTLGLIQIGRRAFRVAERHLSAARKSYETRGRRFWMVIAQYGLAEVSAEEGQIELALQRLAEARDMAVTLPDAQRDRLLALIQRKVDDLRSGISQAGNG